MTGVRPALLLGLLVAAVAVAGWWLLRETPPPADLPPTPTGDGTEPGEAAPVRVEPQARAAAEGGPAATPAGPPPEAKPAEGIRGEVRDERDRPLAGAEVLLSRVEVTALRGLPAEDEERLARSVTARDGTFAIEAFPHDWVRVTASAQGHGSAGAILRGAGGFVVLHLPAAGAVEALVRGADGSPVPRAEVEVVARRARHAATTDAAGRARLEGVAPGAASVRARATGWAEGVTGPVAVPAEGVLRVTLFLQPEVRVAGRVVDARDGAAVAGAEVDVVRPGRATSAGRTDAEGRFAAVPAGAPGERVVLAVRAEGHRAALESVVLEGGSPARVGEAVAEAAERGPDGGQVQEVEVRLEPAAAWTGRVEDLAGHAVEGAEVGYTPDGVAGRAALSTVTDAAGRFVLPAAPPPLPGRRVLLHARAPQGQAALALRPDEVPPQPVVLRLVRGTSVGGRVVDAEGRPVEGAAVEILPAWRWIADRARPGPATSRLLAENALGRPGLRAVTDPSGAWRIEDLPTATYLLRAEHGRRAAERLLEVAGQPLHAGDLVLGAGARVSGRVRDHGGAPLAGVQVRLVGSLAADRPGRTEPTPPADGSVQSRASWSDAGGGWSIEGVPEGAWTLRASLPGHEEATAPVDVAGEDLHLDVVLGPRARLHVRVATEAGPYAGPVRARLESLAGAGGRPETWLLVESGRLEVEDVPEGAWRLRLQTPDLRVGDAEVAAGRGTTHELLVSLRGAATIEGIVRTSAGEPAAGATLELRAQHGTSRHAATARADGSFRIGGIAPGTWRLLVRGRGGAPLERLLVVAPGHVARADLALEPAGALRVRVEGADGRARRGAVVGVRAPDAAWPVSFPPQRTGEDGRVELPDLPPGRVDLAVRTATGESGRASAPVEAGVTRDVTVVVSR